MDFVKFYIVQVLKSAASRIRVIDKDKERLLSRLVSKIENSQDLFPDLKEMERVVELEEAATKLISIYRRLNKSHIDFEKISYQFSSDRDSVQSILRRLIQGNFKKGTSLRKRPKIVFDDTTFTIYELKEPENIESEEPEIEKPHQPRLELDEFLKANEENIVSIKSEKDVDTEIQIDKKITITDISAEHNGCVPDQIEAKDKIELEIDNGLAKKSLEEKSKEKIMEKSKIEEDLVLSLDFDWDNVSREIDGNLREDLTLSEKPSLDAFEQVNIKPEEKQLIEETELEFRGLEQVEPEKEVELISDETLTHSEENEKKTTQQVLEEIKEEESCEGNELLKNIKFESPDSLYLEFENLVLQNILNTDEFLNKALQKQFADEETLKLIQEAYRCHQLAQELGFDFISELIKVYWLSLVAIRDHKIKLQKSDTVLIRSTLIVLVSLLKQRDIDLESFINQHNLLKEKLKQLGYEV